MAGFQLIDNTRTSGTGVTETLVVGIGNGGFGSGDTDGILCQVGSESGSKSGADADYLRI